MGRDAVSFYSHLLTQMYIRETCDAFYLCGDLNSRIGSQRDFIEEVDEVAQCVPIDISKNKHGDCLLEF